MNICAMVELNENHEVYSSLRYIYANVSGVRRLLIEVVIR